MDHQALIAAAAREMAALIEAVAAGPASAPVPTCADWKVADLAEHVGNFCGFWTHDLCRGPVDPRPRSHPSPLVRTQSTGSPRSATTCTVSYGPVLQRRRSGRGSNPTRRHASSPGASQTSSQCTGTTLKRARGTCTPIDAPLAVDGIDELFGALLATRPRTGDATGQTLHVHGSDAPDATGAEWLVTLLPDRIDVRCEHRKADLTLRGAASDLELLLYGRPPLGPVERLGDTSVLQIWLDEFTF